MDEFNRTDYNDDLNGERRPTTLKPYHGLILFLIVIALLIYVATPIQQAFRLYGVALTEIMLLACALIATFALKQKPKEIFPFKMPRLRPFFASLLTWLSAYALTTAVTLLSMYFFPQLYQVSNAIGSLITELPFGLSFFIVAIMPAICEEMLFRGFIFSSFKRLKPVWAVLLCGLLFGVFHLDPLRTLPTALLGIGFGYMLIKTDNLIYPVLFHFINNALSTIASFSQPANELAQAYDLSTVFSGEMFVVSIVIYVLIAATLFYFAFRLFKPKKSKAEEAAEYALLTPEEKVAKDKENSRKRTNKIVLFIFTLLIVAPIISSNLSRLFSTSNSYEQTAPQITAENIIEYDAQFLFNDETDAVRLPFYVPADGEYTMDIIIESNRGLTEFMLLSADGENLFSNYGMYGTMTNLAVPLQQGDYTALFTFYLSNAEEFLIEMGYDQNTEVEDLSAVIDKLNIGDPVAYTPIHLRFVIK